MTLDLEDLESKLNANTRLVAVGYASNAVGTINPVAEIVARAHEVGALTYVDAVAYAPHGPIDVQALDTDFLVCSAYKWFGPHLGALYGKAEVLDRLPAFKVRPAHDRFETGTPAYESIAGTLAATDYLRDVGRSYGDVAGAPGAAAASERRRELVAGMIAIVDYERGLVGRLVAGLGAIRGVTIHGITDPARAAERVPTVSVIGRWDIAASGGGGPGSRGHLRLGWRLLRDRPHRAARQGGDGRRPPPRAGPLQHRRGGGPDAGGAGHHRHPIVRGPGRRLAPRPRSAHHRARVAAGTALATTMNGDPDLMRTTSRRAGLAGALTIAALTFAACGGSAATPTPTATPAGGATPTAAPTATAPGATPTAPGAIPTFDLSALTAGIPGVDSYRTSFSTGGVVSYTSVVVTKPVLSKAITTFNDDGTIESRIVVIGEEAWTADGDDGPFEVIPAALAPTMLLAFDPTLMLAGYASADLGSIGANQGTEDKNGVRAVHIKIDATTALGLAGAIPPGASIDIWIAEAGFIVAWEMTGFGDDEDLSIQVTDVNDPANVVERPS